MSEECNDRCPYYSRCNVRKLKENDELIRKADGKPIDKQKVGNLFKNFYDLK